ncbi:MAG: hypothetical protein KME28_26960 [Pelatocladus maniniholoensis HA4357-MV3]|jgi:hypothetical protein|uniref:Uncharacterized protein n=1 Tax=Pelatocladus maniniholoensis HA4357-MV3 TaxID=1117104 RepID=A0A9E3LWI8_9NOST|nr:hypothetical protein [Pelatocladus maniniholoensis HA4357-MV3]
MIREINRKSKIQNSQESGLIRGVNPKSKILLEDDRFLFFFLLPFNSYEFASCFMPGNPSTALAHFLLLPYLVMKVANLVKTLFFLYI